MSSERKVYSSSFMRMQHVSTAILYACGGGYLTVFGSGGGYFASTMRDCPAEATLLKKKSQDMNVFPISLSKSTMKQLGALKDADSITVDPHKTGYISYPA